MSILLFDTETIGFFLDREPIDHPGQPHLVQIAAQLCEDDGQIIGSFSYIVNPGVDIPEQASKVHGITTDKAKALGITNEAAVAAFRHFYQIADLVVAHNIKFDKGVMEVAIYRQFGKIMSLKKQLFCTMEAAAPIVDLPPTERMISAGFNKPKPPKLEECIKHFFDEKLDGAHDAMVDVIACRRVYFHLQTLKVAA